MSTNRSRDRSNFYSFIYRRISPSMPELPLESTLVNSLVDVENK